MKTGRQFLLSSAFGSLLAVLAVVGLYMPGGAPHPTSTGAGARAAVPDRPAASQVGASAAPRGRGSDLSTRRLSAAQVARAFFTTYLTFSYGHVGTRIAEAAPALAAKLEAERPEVPTRVSSRSPEITELTVEPVSQLATAALAVVNDGALRYTLLATVARWQGRLVVTRFQPWG